MTIVAQKAAARAAALARRAAVSPEVRARFAVRLAEAGLAFVRPQDAPAETVVSVYRPIRGEVETAPLLQALSRAGFITALPLTLGRDAPLRFHVWAPGDPVAAGRWGIPEPLPGAPLADPDILFVPLAAFDRRGFRLGYGAGFYDNALLDLRRRKPALAIGVAFATQEVDSVPCEPHDQRLDAVITEEDIIVPGPL